MIYNKKTNMQRKETHPGPTPIREDQLQEQLRKIEAQILKNTPDPIDKKNEDKFLDWCEDRPGVIFVHRLMGRRKEILDTLFKVHCTDAEIDRLKRINNMLLDRTNRMFKSTADIYRSYLAISNGSKRDVYKICRNIVPIFSQPCSILRLEDDYYYGSDFVRMAVILQETEDYMLDMSLVNPNSGGNEMSSMTDEELGCKNKFDDGISWAKGLLQDPKLKHLNICYALHALCTHMNYSLPDILRINDFKIEITLTVQQFFDQTNN